MAALQVDPPAGQVPAGGGVITHNLTNGGASRLVFKVPLSELNCPKRCSTKSNPPQLLAVAGEELEQRAVPCEAGLRVRGAGRRRSPRDHAHRRPAQGRQVRQLVHTREASPLPLAVMLLPAAMLLVMRSVGRCGRA